MHAGMGPLRIDMELGQKGVSSSQARAAIYPRGQRLGRPCAREAMTKRFSDAPSATWQKNKKRYRFLQQRGFESEQIRQVLG